MRSLIKLTGRSGSSEIGLDALAQIRARAESGGGLSKSGWLVDTTKDWFCGTKLRDAKTCLYKLVALETSDNERLQQFSRLKGLISDGYRDRLVEIETADGFALAIAINAIDGNYLGFLTLYDFSDPATVCNLDHIQRRIDDAFNLRNRARMLTATWETLCAAPLMPSMCLKAHVIPFAATRAP